MGKAYLSQEDAPQTPVRGVGPQSEQKPPVLASVLSPMTPLSSSDEDADGIFSPPSSVYTDATDDDGWDTPTKQRPGRSNRSCSTSLFPSSFDQLKAENSPYMGPGITYPTDTECFIADQALPSEEPSQYIQKLNINTEDLLDLTSSLNGATFCGHRTGRYLVQTQQSTRGRSASLGHIESYTSQTRATRTSECPRSRSLDSWSLRCQEVCDGPRASCAPSYTHMVPNIEVSPPKNTSDVTIITKHSTLSDVKSPTVKSTEKGHFKFNVSDVTFATPSSDNGAKTNRLAIRGQTKDRRRTINSFSTQMRESYPENPGSNSRYSFSSAVLGSLHLSSEGLNHHSASEEAKAPDHSLSKVSGHQRRHFMNLMPDIDFLQDGEAHHRRNRSSTPVDTIYSGDQIRLTSNYYPARIHRENDQSLPQTDTTEKHTNRKYAHQTLIPYYPKSYKWKSISKVLEEKIIAPLSENEIKREGHIYIYWHPGNFGRVKIGYTKDIEQRLRDWEKQCKKTLYIHFPKEEERGRPVQHIARVEKLVHAELKDYRRQEVQCPGCARRHIEWFELDKNVAVDVVKKWTTWMTKMPYIRKDRGGESQWVLTDEAWKLSRDICKPHERLQG